MGDVPAEWRRCQLLARLAAAEQEIARLRAGESDEPKRPGVALTAGQWLRLWNDLPAPQRIRWVGRIVVGLRAAVRCMQEDHDSAVRAAAAAVEYRGVAVRLAAQLLARADTEPHGYLDWVPDDILADAETLTGDDDGEGEGEAWAPGVTAHAGELRASPCPDCGGDVLAATIYGLADTGSMIIGGLAVCHDCGWSPYSSVDLP